jgi:hypothetical protein
MSDFPKMIAVMLAAEYYRQVKALPPEKRAAVVEFTNEALKELERNDLHDDASRL